MKGIAKLAAICSYCFFALLAYVLFGGGETRYILETGFSAIGNLVQNFIGLSTWMDPLRETSFPQNWTIYYWAYWMVSVSYTHLILEEHRFCLAQSAAIHHRHHRRQHRLFKRRAQSLHVGDVWDTLGLAGCAHIDIGLDGIGNDHVRLKLVQHLPVRLQQLHILEGVDAAAVNIRLDAAQPHGRCV